MTSCIYGQKQVICLYSLIPLGLHTSLLWLSRKTKMNLIMQFWSDLIISEKSQQNHIGNKWMNDYGKPTLMHLLSLFVDSFPNNQTEISFFWSSGLLTACDKHLMLNPYSILDYISSLLIVYVELLLWHCTGKSCRDAESTSDSFSSHGIYPRRS